MVWEWCGNGVGRELKELKGEHSFRDGGGGQGLYRDVKTSSNTKRIEYYDVSLNQF